MRTLRHLLGTALIVGIASVPAFAGPRHVVPPSALSGAVQAHAAAQDRQRAAVIDTLNRPEVKAVADGAGLDVRELADAVKTLSPSQLERVTTSANAVNDSLVGGASTITISTTTIIIGLLILILLIVAID